MRIAIASFRHLTLATTVFGLEAGILALQSARAASDCAASMSTDDRHIEPSEFLLAPGRRVSRVLTVGNRLIDAHEREVIKAGGKYRWFGHTSADNMIGSKTNRGDLLTYINSGQIDHVWTYDN